MERTLTVDPGSTSSSLLQRAQSRDPAAWQRLVQLYGPLVYRWCRRGGLQQTDAADLVQDVFLAVAERLPEFRHDRPEDTFRGWLWGITRNKVADHFRARYRETQAPGGTSAQECLAELPEEFPDSRTNPPLRTSDALQQRAIEFVRASCEERTWQAFWRLVVDGLSAATVADELQMTTKAVYQAKYRVLRQIRAEFAALD
jgi:RNA polymerase sigma-70 factor (ECF subfamily)